MKRQTNRLGGHVTKQEFTHGQHKAWCREMLASDVQYPQYGGYAMRDNGRKVGLCECTHCGWRGSFKELAHAVVMSSKSLRRPVGYCPNCLQRTFWVKLSEGQAAVLAP